MHPVSPCLCGVKRYEHTGVCITRVETVKVSAIEQHFREVGITMDNMIRILVLLSPSKPCLQWRAGSGSVVFSGGELALHVFSRP